MKFIKWGCLFLHDTTSCLCFSPLFLMEFVFCRWVFLAFLLIPSTHSALAVDGLNGDSKVRGVNLGGCLVLEGWIKPSLFDGIPNGDMLDGTQVQFKSVSSNKYVSAQDGGGQNVNVDRDVPSSWETFRVRFRTSVM
ncbi:hypothetical protein C5167_008079 [Papaver somniferum]|uniref:DUF7910 domain-containing protein n=1 Tax=Papaver somniferum TaxID=3469 RepID=A0A4Y7JUZ7_PAPSO|nr:hypothetical protein C5167_008079 [Papaver somniferum]